MEEAGGWGRGWDRWGTYPSGQASLRGWGWGWGWGWVWGLEMELSYKCECSGCLEVSDTGEGLSEGLRLHCPALRAAWDVHLPHCLSL